MSPLYFETLVALAHKTLRLQALTLSAHLPDQGIDLCTITDLGNELGTLIRLSAVLKTLSGLLRAFRLLSLNCGVWSYIYNHIYKTGFTFILIFNLQVIKYLRRVYVFY